MNEFLKERILRRIESMPDERAYQVLDYVEFLESKYATQQPADPNIVQRFAEGVQDTLRAGNVSAKAIGDTMGYLSKAMGVLSGAKAAAESVVNDVSGVVKKAVDAGKEASKAPVPSAGKENKPDQSPETGD